MGSVLTVDAKTAPPEETNRYEPGQWRAKRRSQSGRIEVVRVNAAGHVYERSTVSYSKWDKAKLDADTWNEMEATESPKGIGGALAVLRRLAGLSVAESARRIGVAERFLWHAEDGREPVTAGLFAIAANAYATELQRVGIEPSSCGECYAVTMMPIHDCHEPRG